MSTPTPVPRPLNPWHVGRWTLPATAPGQTDTSGNTLTHHELLFDLITVARAQGWADERPDETATLLRAESLLEATPLGRGVLPPPLADAVKVVADRAFAWLAPQAPSGYRFERTDGLQLVPADNLAAEVVAPETAIQVAHTRGIDLPTELLARAKAHVVKTSDGWTALNVPFRVGGPVNTEAEAVAIVAAARKQLVRILQDAGAHDLAETGSRWSPIPVHD